MSRKPFPKGLHAQILERDGHRCVRCSSTFGLQVHHRLYRSRGGLDDPINLVTLCIQCHLEAHTLSLAPYVVPGFMLKGVYVGTDPEFQAFYNGAESPAQTPLSGSDAA